MKILAKPIKTIVVFSPEKNPVPYKFKLENENGEVITVIINQILYSYRTKIAGIESIIYECQSVIDGIEKRYELKYIISKCQWQLYKM